MHGLCLLNRACRARRDTSSACLDLHFWPNDRDVLAVATSSGTIELYQVDLKDSYQILATRSFQICDSATLVLSLCWPPIPNPSRLALGFSLSSGEIGCLRWSNVDYSVELTKVHSLEAWTVAWLQHKGDHPCKEIFSGGDDSALVMSTISDNSVDDEHNLTIRKQNYRIHNAGVTAILPLPNVKADGPNSLASQQEACSLIFTGSYDEHVRLLMYNSSTSNFNVLAEKHLGGGVWRLKEIEWNPYRHPMDNQSHPHSPFREPSTASNNIKILASCMHAGVRVLDIRYSEDEHQWLIDVYAQFTEHQSMNYASDTPRHSQGEETEMTVVSTSFYDRKVCVWGLGDNRT